MGYNFESSFNPQEDPVDRNKERTAYENIKGGVEGGNERIDLDELVREVVRENTSPRIQDEKFKEAALHTLAEQAHTLQDLGKDTETIKEVLSRDLEDLLKK